MFPQNQLVDLPAVFEGMPERVTAVANVFNGAMRDLSWNSPDPLPMVLAEALDYTFTTFPDMDRHHVMDTLVHCGLNAPQSALPKDLQMHGYGPAEGAMRLAGGAVDMLSDTACAFGRSVRGAVGQFMDAFGPPGVEMQPAYAYAKPSGYNHT